jgi:hypothetical protein
MIKPLNCDWNRGNNSPRKATVRLRHGPLAQRVYQTTARWCLPKSEEVDENQSEELVKHGREREQGIPDAITDPGTKSRQTRELGMTISRTARGSGDGRSVILSRPNVGS